MSPSGHGARGGFGGLPWSRLAAEFTVIVVGVLVALVLESWWSEREERRFEAELRDDMVEEFRANLDILDADLEENALAAASLNRYADLGDVALLALPDSDFTFWSAGQFVWAGFDPSMGNVQAVVESGNLGAIADRTLRLRLSRWSGLLDEKDRFNRQAADFQLQAFLPTAFRFGADGRWTPEERTELRSQIRVLRALHQYVIRNQANLRDAAQSILDYLDS